MFHPSLASSGFGTSSFAMTTATQAESAAREAQTSADLLRHDIDRVLLITEAMWTFMKQEHGYTDDKLVQLVQDLDQKKMTAAATSVKDPPITCPSCGRNNMATRPFCMYCGKPLKMNPFAR